MDMVELLRLHLYFVLGSVLVVRSNGMPALMRLEMTSINKKYSVLLKSGRNGRMPDRTGCPVGEVPVYLKSLRIFPQNITCNVFQESSKNISLNIVDKFGEYIPILYCQNICL